MIHTRATGARVAAQDTTNVCVVYLGVDWSLMNCHVLHLHVG